jgi:hypothetical protein
MYFQVEATWRPDSSGERLKVDLTFCQLIRLADEAPASLGNLIDDEHPSVRRQIGTVTVAHPELVTLLRARRVALEWLRDNAGMTGDDSIEFRLSTQADIAFLDRLTALTAA